LLTGGVLATVIRQIQTELAADVRMAQHDAGADDGATVQERREGRP